MKKILIGLLVSFALTGVSYAGSYGIGVTGSLAGVHADGTEADKDGTSDSSVRTATASETAIIPSLFGEYSWDNGFTVGLDYVLGTANVNSKKITRTDDSAESAQDGDRSAQAEIENVTTIYVEVPVHAGLYLKGGFVQMDVNTLETDTVTTAGSYGNSSVDGTVLGFGYRNSFGTNGFYKVEGTFTEMDTVTFNSTTTDKGNKITADLDVTKATFAIGYNF
tara:strand:- start:161 stop:826 length:666 start_codon:yes stop_codon:yes gene_type:complete